MNNETPWTLLRCGEIGSGILLMQEEFKREPSPSHVLQLGVAYLLAEQYQAASRHFQHAIATDRAPGEILYALAGVAEWCVDNYSAAVSHWQTGAMARYAVGGVCIHSPMLLLAASIIRPTTFSKELAESMLSEKVKDPRAGNWPGTLGRFVLGMIDETSLEASWVGYIAQNVRGVPPHRKWMTRFYKKVLERGREEISIIDFRKLMRLMVDTSQPDWSHEGDFVHLVRNAEFFVARHESSGI